MGKYRNIFFSEAIALIEPKLCINHWKVLYKLCVFLCWSEVLCSNYVLHRQPSWISDQHKKPKLFRGPSNDYSWAAWFQLSKWFKRRSVLKHFPHGIGSNVKLSQVIVLTQDHMGKYRNIFFSEAIALIEPKLCINQSLEGPLQTLCFFMLIGILSW
jgi:hypothetical protein